MKLELKHLSPYLPYGLKISCNNDNVIEMGAYPSPKRKLIDIESVCGTPEWKPILRPLSDLTKEIEHNGEKLSKRTMEVIKDRDWGLIHFCPHHDVKKLFEWHFDVHGLIEAGLAIDINTLEKHQNKIK